MGTFNDLLISAIVAAVAWLAYDRLGTGWAVAVLVVATAGFIWWLTRRGPGQQ